MRSEAYTVAKEKFHINWQELSDDALKSLVEQFRSYMAKNEESMYPEEADDVWKDFDALLSYTGGRLGLEIDLKNKMALPWEERDGSKPLIFVTDKKEKYRKLIVDIIDAVQHLSNKTGALFSAMHADGIECDDGIFDTIDGIKDGDEDIEYVLSIILGGLPENAGDVTENT